MDTSPLPQLRNDMQLACDGEQPPANQDYSQSEEVPPVNKVPTRWSSALNLLNNILLGDDYSERSAQLPTYSSTVQGVILVNTLVGSYGLQAWDCSEAILCSFTGTPSGSTFFKLAKSKFRKHQGHQVAILKATKKATQVFEVAIDGIRFQIEYCQVPFTTESGILDVLSAVKKDANMLSLASTKQKSYGIAAYLASHIPDLYIFQQSYRQIKEWAIRQGVYSAKFWYLNESQLLLMVAAVCLNHTITTVERLLQGFFNLYGSADLRTEFPCDENAFSRVHDDTGKPSRASNIVCPWLRSSDYTTMQTLQTIADCIYDTKSTISTKDLSSIHKFLESCDGLADFASKYETYIKVDISYWGPSQPTGARYVESIESTVANWVTSMSTKDIHFKSSNSDPKLTTSSTHTVILPSGPRMALPPRSPHKRPISFILRSLLPHRRKISTLGPHHIHRASPHLHPHPLLLQPSHHVQRCVYPHPPLRHRPYPRPDSLASPPSRSATLLWLGLRPQ